jgi:hypothetical protein
MNRLDTFGYFHLFECFDVQQKKKVPSFPIAVEWELKGARLGGCLSSFSLKWNILPSELNEEKILA